MHSTTAMSEVSHLAGKAINFSKTTAPHTLSYPITMEHKIPHGHAVTLTLGYFLLLILIFLTTKQRKIGIKAK